tara:strand:- start:68 stop:1309 length:1242 start_codon:yes stop_codon:yes gene_type:complete
MFDYIIIGGGISGLYNYIKLIEKDENLKIKLFEKNDYFGGRIRQHNEYYLGHEYSFPCGAARFNINHKNVIKLMKDFGLLDMRTHKGQLPNTKFIDVKNDFNENLQKKDGYDYINEILKHASKIDPYILKQYTFQEFAEKYVSQKEMDYILNSCGYSGQLKHMNMYDAKRLFGEGIRNDVKFFLGKFQLLVNKMIEYLKDKHANIRLRTNVKSIQYNTNHDAYKIIYNDFFVYARKVVLCLPKETLLKLSILNPIKTILDETISTKPLCRVYAIFDKSETWLKNIKQKIFTNNELRFIIPIDPENGLIMISYTDDIHTQFWHKRKNSQTILKKTIVKLVNDTFNIKINKPLKVIVCYWKSGVAYWNKNINSDVVSKYIANPIPNIYICGENYSQNQSWVEGSLESCNYFLSKQ